MSAQGTFQNLDFEQSTIPPTPVGGYGGAVNPTAAFPDWTVGGGGTALYVLYNVETLGSPAVDLIGPDFPNALGIAPLQGSYSVLLQYHGALFPGWDPPTISQTGMIPENAQSISFLVSPSEDNGVLEVNGTSIPLFPIAAGQLAGNISAWSGQTVQLTFTTPEHRRYFLLRRCQLFPDRGNSRTQSHCFGRNWERPVCAVSTFPDGRQ